MSLLKSQKPRTVAEARENLFRAVEQGVWILLGGIAVLVSTGLLLDIPRVVIAVWVTVLAFGVPAELVLGIALDLWLSRKSDEGGKR